MKPVRTAQFATVAAVVASSGLLLPSTAGAIPGPNGIKEVVAGVGAGTTYELTSEILAAANVSTANTDPDSYVNVPAVLPSGQSFFVPADPFDPGTTYSSANPPPNGAVAGKLALANAAAAGSASIELARSDVYRSASDPSTFEFYGFAKDAVSWAASSTGAGAGLSLSLDQLRSIYNGTTTNWNQVGGADAPITVYLPRTESGTLAFFTNTMLGFDPTTKPVSIKRFQENDATTIPAADQATAIAPYSAGQWIAQANGIVSDKRAGLFEGTLTGAGSDGAPVTGSAPNYAPAYTDAFLGARTVYHVVDTRSKSYAPTLNAVGFDSDGPSPLCAGGLASTISRYGFKPLPPDAVGITCTLS